MMQKERGTYNNNNNNTIFGQLADFISCSFPVSTLISGCCTELKSAIETGQYLCAFDPTARNFFWQ
jgi:hypothetical protein